MIKELHRTQGVAAGRRTTAIRADCKASSGVLQDRRSSPPCCRCLQRFAHAGFQGDGCPRFVVSYWNLSSYSQRGGIPSHLPQVLPCAKLTTRSVGHPLEPDMSDGLPRQLQHLVRRLRALVSARPPARAARAMPRGHLATFTSKVTLFAPPELRTSSSNFPSFTGVNFSSHFGPGLVSLPTTCLFSS